MQRRRSALCESDCSQEGWLSLSLTVGEDETQTFEASMMTADELSTSSVGTCMLITVHARTILFPAALSAKKANITQRVGELRCA